jgi:photosystem II stability/assembly factor-like uncharacterized protein
MAGAGGVLKSTDGGLTWNAVNPSLSANTAVQLLAIDPVASSTIYMITEGAIFKSTDGGTKWNKVTATGLTNILVQTIVMNRLDAATLYAAAGDSVFKSLDGGANWSTLFSFQLALASVPGFFAPPFPAISPAYLRTLLIDFANPDILYAGTYRANGCFFADNLLFKTTDGGLTWTDSITPDKTGCVMGGFFGPSGGLKAMDPTDPNILYVAAVDDEDAGYWLLRSSDGGASWKTMEKYPGGGQAGVWAFVIDPSNPATIYAGLDDVPEYSFVDETVKPGLGGIFKSRDGGASWDRIGPTGAAVNLLVIDSADPKVLYAATEGNYGAPRGFRGLLKSTDSGASWSRAGNGLAVLVDTGARMTALVIDPANSNTLYAAASGAGVFKSSDGGANWSRLNDGLANLDVRTLIGAPGARHTLYAGTSGGVFKLVDDAR